MTTQVVLALSGDVERAALMWATVTGADVEHVALTAIYDQMKSWDKGLPQSIRELRDEAHDLLMD